MAYDTNLQGKSGGKTRETSDKGVPGSGVYQHPSAIDQETGELAQVITIEDPLFGNSQAEAAMQVGFKYLRPANEGEVKSIIGLQKGTVQPLDAVSQAKEDKERLDQLELANLRREKKEREEAEAQATASKKEETKTSK